MKTKTTRLTRLAKEQIMKPYVITCTKCGGELHVIPICNGEKTINICGKCTFEE